MTATIVIADNKEKFANQVVQFLRAAGYSVIAATDVDSARAALRRRDIDLAILDLRLADDSDEEDVSGLELAKSERPDVPKIILTGYPTLEAVRQALGPRLSGLPPAVGFVSKREGLPVLLNRIRLVLSPMSVAMRTKLLEAFETTTAVYLPERVRELGPTVSNQRLEQAIGSQRRELSQHRELEERQAAHHHVAAFVASAAGGVFLIVALGLFLAQSVGHSAVSLVATLITKVVEVLFYRKEQEARRRASNDFLNLEKLNRVYEAMELANCLEDPKDRDVYRKRIIDHMLASDLQPIESVQVQEEIGPSAVHGA
jgi:DNA-binding response OmpR family regulator